MNGISLIETLHFGPRTGFRHLARHRARMAASADALGLPFDPALFEARLSQVPADAGEQRVRLELFADGRLELVHAGFVPLPDDTVWTLRLARTRLSSEDPLLAHKTSRRAVYVAARAEFTPAQAEEVLLLNEHDAVCEGTITSLFAERDDGILVTPPQSCGLLCGVLRAVLLASGQAVEGLLSPADLLDRPLHVGNSLRGLIRAGLAPPSP